MGNNIMSGFMRSLTAAAVVVSLCAVPTAVIAREPSAQVAAAPAPVAAVPSNPWVTLSAMTTSSSAAAAAVAQDEDHKCSSATSASTDQDDDRICLPPIAPLAVILATIGTAIYILVHDDNGHLGFSISPA
jgi:hypothetical protein